jgi:hypothetical protein
MCKICHNIKRDLADGGYACMCFLGLHLYRGYKMNMVDVSYHPGPEFVAEEFSRLKRFLRSRGYLWKTMTLRTLGVNFFVEIHALCYINLPPVRKNVYI